jgi:hypothetical protein
LYYSKKRYFLSKKVYKVNFWYKLADLEILNLTITEKIDNEYELNKKLLKKVISKSIYVILNIQALSDNSLKNN